VIDILEMVDPFDAEGAEALAGSWSTVPNAMHPDVSLVPRAQGTSSSMPLQGGFSVNPAFGYLGGSAPSSPLSPLNSPAPESQINMAASRLAYTPGYGVNVGAGGGGSAGPYLPGRTSPYGVLDYTETSSQHTPRRQPSGQSVLYSPGSPGGQSTPYISAVGNQSTQYPPATPRGADHPNNRYGHLDHTLV
jgi:hypothetical protein